MTVAVRPSRGVRLASAGWVMCVLAFLVLSALLALARPEPMPASVLQVSLRTTEQSVGFSAGGSAIVRFSEGDRTLTVTEHAPRDLLVCLRDDCRLVEEWIGK